MKKIISGLASLGMIFSLAVCANAAPLTNQIQDNIHSNKVEESMTEKNFKQIFPLGEKNDAYAKYFVGQSYLSMLTNQGVNIANVTFEPGCRNNWHIHHEGGQILLCTAGRGYYQEWGKKPQEMKPGDVINIPAGVKHWHGAAPDSWFSHLAVEVPAEGGSTEWLEAVDDNEYKQLAVPQAEQKVTAGQDILGDFAPKFAELNDDVLFGEVWSRDELLSKRDRSIVTLTSLMASGILDSSLTFHIGEAKKNGVTKEEMAEILTHAAFYAGWPKAWAAFRIAQDIYKE